MNNLQVFNKSELGQVRVIGDKDNPLFCLRDVCDILGIVNNSDVKTSIIKEFGDDLDLIYPISDNLGRQQNATFITEPQLYFVLMRSDKPKARPFRQWVVNDVLPQIRKTGSYNHQAPKNMVEALELALNQARQIAELNNKIEANKPKVAFADSVASSSDTISVGQMAKLIQQNGVDIGRKRLFDYLRENGYLIKGKSKDLNMPSQKSMEQGLFQIKETVIDTGSKAIISLTPRVTTKGQEYFLRLFGCN